MKKVKLGNTGEEVSSICLGTMYLGTKQDRKTSFEIMDAYADAGGMFIDSANIYAHWIPGFVGGESDAIIGAWLHERKNRSKMFITTKVGFDIPGRGLKKTLSPEIIEQECDRSLKAMGVDTIDLFFAHVDDYNTPIEETLFTYDKLVKAGKVRYVGASNFLAWRLNEALLISEAGKLPSYCCIQQRFTYLRINPEADTSPQIVMNQDLFDLCKNKGITMMAYSPLLQGAYSKEGMSIPSGYEGPSNEKRKKVLFEIAKEKNVSANQLVLAWMMHRTPSIIPLAAADDRSMLIDNLRALEIELSHEEVEMLNKA